MRNANSKPKAPGTSIFCLHLVLALSALCYLTNPLYGQGGTHSSEVGTAGVAPSPVLHSRDAGSLLIGTGDLVDVRVFETPDLSSKQRVDASGAIDLPVAGHTQIVGLSTEDAARAIEDKLKSAQIMLKPRVTVFVAEYATQSVSVLGDVKSPGNYLLLGPHSLYSAISAAGGTAEKAGSTITVTHASDPQNPEIVHVDKPDYSELERATNVRNGDIVFVAHSDSIYVLGDVTHPGEFPIGTGRQLNVLNAVALAQGTTSSAAVTRALVLRKTETGTRAIPVNLTSIAQNDAVDLTLRPDDILVIPHDRKRAFVDSTLPGLTGALVGSAMGAVVLLLSR